MPDILDQALHRLLGYMLARSLRKTGLTPGQKVEWVMNIAKAREELQHPGRCGPGCARDLDNWRAGAERGAR